MLHLQMNIKETYEDMNKENKRKQSTGPTVAPGMDDTEELEQNATQAEVEQGEYTEVTNLSYDEVNPS